MHPHIATAHLLRALLHADAGLYPLLKQMDKDIFYLEEWTDVRLETLPKATRLDETLVADEQVKAVIEEADIIRLMTGKDQLEPLHVLAAISTPGVGFSYDQLKTWPLQRQELVQQAMNDGPAKKENGNGRTGSVTEKKYTGLIKILHAQE